MKYIELTQGMRAMVDDDLYNWLNQWKWRYHKRAGNRKGGDAVRTLHGIDSDGHDTVQILYMSRVILPLAKGFMVDHKDTDPLNNQRNNLRRARNMQNTRNSKVRITSKTGVKGVHWNERKQHFIAQIGVDYKKIWLGSYKTVEEAKIVYDKAAKKYHGRFARS